MINKQFLIKNNIKSLRKQFENSKPFPHLVLKDFFDKELIEDLVKALKREYLLT